MKLLTPLIGIAAAVVVASCGGSEGNSGSTGSGGNSGGEVTAGAPSATLSVYPTVLAGGESSVITWSSTNATSCTASGGWSGTVAASGTQSTGALTADSTFSVTCSGAGGPNASATAAVAISATVMGVSPAIAAITPARTQQFTATVPGGGPATWTVDGIPGGNSTVGSINDSGLFTAGSAAGAHNIVVTSVANNTKSATAVAAVTDLAGVYTYHNNLSRDGTNIQEYALSKNTVTASRFGKLTSCAVDGAVQAQPLWAANSTVGGAKHNVVFVATQHDGLYAFDADAVPCTKLWSVSLIDGKHGGATGETVVPSTLVGAGFGDVKPEIGATGTPVIEPGRGLLYVVSKSVNSAQTTFYQRLHAIDLATGNEMSGSPVTITGTYPGTGDGGTTVAFDAKQEFQRPGLALVNGVVYVTFASHEDTYPYYGWMMGYQFSGTAWAQTAVINVSPNTHESGIWMSGGAPAADANNKLYIVTANGIFDTLHGDYGDSLLQLTPAPPKFVVSQYFTPDDEMIDRLMDKDFGSGGAAVLADLPAGNTVTHALICGGKDNFLYVINRDLMGTTGDSAAVQRLNFGGGIFSTGAFWNNSLYLAGSNTPLQAYRLNTSTVQLSQTSVSYHTYGFPGATPSVSASSATQNGIVWSLDTNKNCGASGCGPAVLYAYDASNVATELWNSSLSASDAAGFAVKFTVPTVANGRVYVGTRGNNTGSANSSSSVPGELDIYGIRQ
jgi:hypothetical protein